MPGSYTLSRRNATVTIRRRADGAPQGSVNVIVNSTGLKVCSQVEWRSQKHGDKKRRRWKKRHLGVDDEGCLLSSWVIDGHEQDPGQAPDLLSQFDQEIDSCVADRICDQASAYAAVESHSLGARVITPPRKNAALGPTAEASPTQQDKHLAAIELDGVFAWKRRSGYDAQSHAEDAFARYKRMFGGRLGAKRDESEQRETEIACPLLKWMRALGRPQSDPVR